MRAASKASIRRVAAWAGILGLFALAPAGAGRAAEVRGVGRVTLDASDPDAIRFGWQGSGVVATVRGSRIAARLASEDGREIFFHLVVDGKPLPRFSVSSKTGQDVVLADGLGKGRHVVELYRDTESHQGASRFQGFTDGIVEGAPPPSGRLLEVVGDSIAAGYGDLGHEIHSAQGATGECSWAASNSSWAHSFGALAGWALGAEVSTIAMSGWGMVEGHDDDREHAIGKVYGRAYGAYVPGTWTFPRAPQAVVVEIGGNDLGPREKPTFDPQLYVRTGLELVAQIRAHAPDAWILLVLSRWEREPGLSMLREAQQAIVDRRRAGGDRRIERLEFPPPQRSPDGTLVTGCQWHPSAAEHQRFAEALRQRLHERLGW